MNAQKILQDQLEEAVISLGIVNIRPSVFTSEHSKYGEFSSNIGLLLSKPLNQSPMQVAEKLRKILESKNQVFRIIERIDVVKPGFINFFINKPVLFMIMEELLTDMDSALDVKNHKSYIVEYSSPNIAKPFTIGHLRSTIIGDAIANLLEVTGNKVYRDNHVGDWGTQFGKMIYAIKSWGDEKKICQSNKPVKELVDLYVRFHKEAEKNPDLEEKGRIWFKKLEEGDFEARRIWQECVDLSWKEFNSIYEELGIHFTENNGKGYGESYFEKKMKSVNEELKQKGFLKESQEAKLVFFPQDIYPPLMIMKKDGSTLYATRDLATDKFRLEKYGKDIFIINEVGIEQSLYFRQLYCLEEMLGWFRPQQRIHISHGHYRFKEGKMASRKGNVILLEDVIDESKERAKLFIKEANRNSEKALENLTEIVGLGALKWNDLKRSPEQDVLFDWDDLLNMQGNSGPYMQYTYVRAKSILLQVKEKIYIKEVLEISKTYQFSAQEFFLLRKITYFPLIIQQASENLTPHILAVYLYELAQVFNNFYQKVPVLQAESKKIQIRLLLVEASAKVIKQGLTVLGIQTPDKM